MDLINKIKEKKELKGLPDSLVEKTLNEYLKKHNLSIPDKPKQITLIVKEIRSQLRKYVGRFSSASDSKRERLVDNNEISKLLKSHSSTKERLDHYDKLKSILRELTPNSILDLACGINPVAIAPEFPNAKYIAFDINDSDLKVVRHFFKIEGINGFVKQVDICDSKFPKADVCLLLKILDIIETKSHVKAKKIINDLNCKVIIVSFATKTLSGKLMRIPRRGWFEKILRDLGLEYETEMIPGEIFYIIRKL